MTRTRYAYGFEILDYNTRTGTVEREPIELDDGDRGRYARAKCPAVAAGVSLIENQPTMTVAGAYDGRAQARDGDGEHPNGVIGEPDARAAWFEAIEELRERGEDDAADRGREIAREFDWIEIEREHNPDAKVKRIP